jgi:hypothetical protein
MRVLLVTALVLFFVCFQRASAQAPLTPQWLMNPAFDINGGYSTIKHIAATNDGYVYVTGYFNNTADFDPGPDTFNLTAYNGQNIFVAKYTIKGALVFAFNLVSGGVFNYPGSIATDENDNIYLTGIFEYNTDFDPGRDTFSIHFTNSSRGNMFFAKYDSSGHFVFAKGIGGSSGSNASNAIKVDKAHNIYIAGSYEGTKTDFDPGPGVVSLPGDSQGNIFIAKYDPDGNYLFAEGIQGGQNDGANALVIDKQNNIVITGAFKDRYGDNDFDPSDKKASLKSYGGTDVFIAKYDSVGRYLTAASIGGPGFEVGNAIACDKDNNIIVAGSFVSDSMNFGIRGDSIIKPTNGGYDFFIAKYTPDGTLRFVQTGGGKQNDNMTALATDDADNIYVTGSFKSAGVVFNYEDTLFAKGDADIFFAKYSKTGNCLYAKQISGINTESPADIAVAGNTITVAGYFNGAVDFNPGNAAFNLTSQSTNGFLAAYSRGNGSFALAGSFGGYRSFTLYSTVTASTQDKEGNVYITGIFQGRVDFDPSADTLFLVSQTDAYSNRTNYSPHDAFFAKYNKDGKLIFAKDLGSATGAVNPVSIQVDAQQQVYLCGDFYNTADLDPSADTAFFTSHIENDRSNFFAKYDIQGNYLFAKNIVMSMTYGGSINDIAIDASGNMYIAGEFHKAQFNSANPNDITNSTGRLDIYFAKYDASGNFVYVKDIGEKSRNYQNCKTIKITPKGNLLLCGWIQGQKIDFDPSPATYLANSGGGMALYMAGYKTNGSFLFEVNATAATNSSTGISKLVLDGDDIVVAGLLKGTVDFDPGLDTALVVSPYYPTSSFLAKYSSTGKFIFGKYFLPKGNHSPLIPNGVAVDTMHNIYLAGGVTNHTDFDPGADTAYLPDAIPGSTTTNAFIAKYDAGGNYMAAYQMGSRNVYYNGVAMGNDILVDKNSNIVLSGYVTGNTDFDPGEDTFYMRPTYPGFATFFTIKYQQQACPSPYNLIANNISVTTAHLNWAYPFDTQGFQLAYKPVNATAWLVMKIKGTQRAVTINNLQPATTYTWKIRAQCSTDTSLFSATKSFATSAVTAKYINNNGASQTNDGLSMRISPNPVNSSYFQLNLALPANSGKKVVIRLYNVLGLLVYSRQAVVNGDAVAIPVELSSAILPGTYIVTIDIAKQQLKGIVIKL